MLVEAIGRTFAIRADAVHSIVRLGRVAETPGGPDFMIGFTGVKGAIVPVLSLGRRLDPDCRRGEASPFVVIVEAIGRIAAFSVDKIGAVVSVAASDVLPAPHKRETAMAPFHRGAAAPRGRAGADSRCRRAARLSACRDGRRRPQGALELMEGEMKQVLGRRRFAGDSKNRAAHA